MDNIHHNPPLINNKYKIWKGLLNAWHKIPTTLIYPIMENTYLPYLPLTKLPTKYTTTYTSPLSNIPTNLIKNGFHRLEHLGTNPTAESLAFFSTPDNQRRVNKSQSQRWNHQIVARRGG